MNFLDFLPNVVVPIVNSVNKYVTVSMCTNYGLYKSFLVNGTSTKVLLSPKLWQSQPNPA